MCIASLHGLVRILEFDNPFYIRCGFRAPISSGQNDEQNEKVNANVAPFGKE
ncbi:hypothetical protein Pmar_PMAR022641 [Perkinsus marinus ATCC 50983]|uniref:Uncharacterized protein n=1 Tax=Perkinsus marinus (strain ATCC 50983 / TXsc) TaxID=423536 RepID=C5L9J5_PERM5|nr:hypothetical protein Pmar_PMAR022641 [Perkinsus marinus ATCC 50983]EER06588.1 hypothetical protein Pmar_PMAR022641 [Perkinsus marinus ATCC 50983]|eukprot:XP_002774772.1 hypothetical protein Pmar_PMAR022641 [Perkinsus marinus ATCC 50983]